MHTDLYRIFEEYFKSPQKVARERFQAASLYIGNASATVMISVLSESSHLSLFCCAPERHLRSPWRPQTSLLGLRLNKQVNGPRRPSFACESVFATRARHCGINGHFDRPAAFVARATRQNAQVPKRADKMAAKMALGMCKWNRLSSNTVHLKELLVLGPW